MGRDVEIEFDAGEARQWMLAASREHAGVAHDEQTGVFGDHVSLLDFEPADLDRIRALAALTRLERHDRVESAIAIAGSSAQGRVPALPRRQRLLRARARPRRHGGGGCRGAP